jgi:hypothetical protein
MYRYGGRKLPMFILGLLIGALLISPAGAHVSNSFHLPLERPHQATSRFEGLPERFGQPGLLDET